MLFFQGLGNKMIQITFTISYFMKSFIFIDKIKALNGLRVGRYPGVIRTTTTTKAGGRTTRG